MLPNTIYCNKPLWITKTVEQELIYDPDKYPDARQIQANLMKRVIERAPEADLVVPVLSSLGRGELETIAFCEQEGGVPITDDIMALHYALSRGLQPKNTEALLFDLFKGGAMSAAEFDSALDQVIRIKALKPDIADFLRNKAKVLKTSREV